MLEGTHFPSRVGEMLAHTVKLANTTTGPVLNVRILPLNLSLSIYLSISIYINLSLHSKCFGICAFKIEMLKIDLFILALC
jgi:hypothetical protein